MSEQINFSDENAASILAYIPDFHVSKSAFETAEKELRKLAKGKTAYMYLSDIDNKTDRLKFFEEFNLKNPIAVQFEYITKHVLKNDSEREAFQVVSTIEQYGGIEEYLKLVKQQMPSFEAQQQKQMIEEQYRKFKTFNIEEKLNNISEFDQKAIMKQTLEAKLNCHALDLAITEYNAKQVADYVNTSNKNNDSKIKLFLEGGNHTTIQFYQFLEQYFDTPSDVTNIYNTKGAIKIGATNQALEFQGSGNIYGISNQIDGMAYDAEVIDLLYPHMKIHKGLTQNSTKDTFDKIPTEKKETEEFKRITNTGKDKLDVLLLHSEIGDPLGFEGKSIYPSVDDLGIIKTASEYLRPQQAYNNQGLVLSGHVHDTKEGYKKDFNHYTKRTPISIISKKDGQVIVSNITNPTKEKENTYDVNIVKMLYEGHKNHLQKMYFPNS